MTPERWKQVETLYHAALAMPPAQRAAYLAGACPSDESMRRNVESLLDESDEAGDFLEQPASMTGVAIGGYQLRTLLGVGGMGEVYLAHDATLGRDVAIKILSRAFTSDPQRLARFEREARMLASLNHPNICAIYGFEEANGIRFLILELVHGETLAERLAQGPGGKAQGTQGLPLGDTLAIARQIAEALEAAHERGIVHRDLKPANIKITSDGVVKVLDFGLAKISEDSGGAVADTSEGIILGTAAYMSPEQARGKSTDKRTDIWAFGCVLYEMLAGHGMFAGETVSDILGKILEREPDWSAIPASTPVPVRRLLQRCLAKDPKQRLRDIGDARIEIDAIENGEQAPASAPPSVASSTRSTWLPWLALVAVAATAIVWGLRRPAVAPANPMAHAQFSRFTDWEGTESGAEISPDGKFVAFVADRGGKLDLWWSQVGSGQFHDLTGNLPALSAPGGVVRSFGFSGDGADIWFAQAGDSSAPKWFVPLTGGTPRPFLGQGASAPSWSADDTRLAYFMNGKGDPLYLADRTSADAHPLIVDTPGFFASGVHNHNPFWSADGQWLYFAHGLEPTEDMNLWRVPSSGGRPEPLTTGHTAINLLAPIDARTLLYVSRAEDRSGPWLWSLDVETKTTQRVVTGVEHYSSISASRDGRRVVATVTNPTVSLWRLPLSGPQPVEDSAVQPFVVPTARAISPRFSTAGVFYVSASGNGLWRFQDGDASEIWKAAGDPLTEPPAVSPDGRHVAIITREGGKARLLVMSSDGTNARTLAPSLTILGAGGQGNADWSPDSKWIVTAAGDAQGHGLFKIPVDGGAPVRLVAGEVTNPVWSPKGEPIVYGGAVVGGQVPLLGVTPEGAKVALPDVRVRLSGGHRFLPDGSGLVYLPRAQSLDFWVLDFATNKTRVLTKLGDHGTLQTFDITRDGKSIVFDRSRENSDIVLIDLPKN